MAGIGKLGIGLSIVFGCLLLALGAEVYYLLWRKKRITATPTPDTTGGSPSPDYTHYARELLAQLTCWKKQTSVRHPSGDRVPEVKEADDLELGAGKDSDSVAVAKQFGGGEESVESELMRLHNLSGPPRFLFTIKEETREDLDSNDGRSRKGSRARSLSDLVLALDTPFLTPLPSPPLKASSLNNESPLLDSYDNPLFESLAPTKPPPSPPPKFKFLRDAEEKLYRRLKEEEAGAKLKLREIQFQSNNSSELQAQKVTALSSSSRVLPLDLESSPTAARPAPDRKILVR